ncbi:sialidase-like [Phoenix dactylifera]|uniref:Sialidase-like n=1 Tax=Phoenix dactylifera TaxID=42345 RepID=A0A8B9A8J7_PHODC|nr:sialidase-like [Phoenix dactylifera]
MARRVMEIGLALALVSMLLAHASAQSGCTTVILSLAPCLNYITGNSSTPSSSCCSQLASVVQSQPRCLCTLLNGGASSLGITINQTRALALPGACKVKTPPVSQCNAVAGGPAASPAESPEAPSTPATPTTPSTPAPKPSPKTPSVPSSTPATPTTPANPSPETPSVPSGTPAAPTSPSTPANPSPETPSVPSGTPAAPTTPSTPANPSPETPSFPSSTPATTSTPSVPSGPSESGSKTVPSTTGESSHGSSNKSSRSLVISILFLAAGVSLFSL